jgi:hypothetical protein
LSLSIVAKKYGLSRASVVRFVREAKIKKGGGEAGQSL